MVFKPSFFGKKLVLFLVTRLVQKIHFNLMVFWNEILSYVILNWGKLKDKTTRIRARPWIIRLPFKVFGAVILWKNKCKKKNIFLLWHFCNNLHPKRFIKIKVITFAHSKNFFMANKFPSTNLERFLRLNKSPFTR